MEKNMDTLVEDIYPLMVNRNTGDGVDVEEEIDKFGEAMKDIMRKEFLPGGRRDGRKLRLSSVGKNDLIQWFAYNGYRGERIKPHTLIKFMYGHMIEEMLLFLVRLTGHDVTDEQKEVSVGGVKGHMDCKIDGIVTDVKSTTKYGLMKFKDGTLAANHDFGYVDQIKAYAHAEGDFSGDIEERIEHVKKSVKQEDRPSRCYSPEEDGKSGNLKLCTTCSYCQYKRICYPEVRAFFTGSGPKFLTTVVNVPKNRKGVPHPEINLDEQENVND